MMKSIGRKEGVVMNRVLIRLGAMLLALTLICSLGNYPVLALSMAQPAYEKDSFSHYVDREGLAVREELLWGFEEALHYHSLDTTDATQGKGCGMVTLAQDAPSTTLVFHLTNRFLANASDLKKVTFKLDVWINDMSLLGHDHESVQPDGDFSHNGTLYFGLQDENGRNHKIFTSISDNNGYAGWQTLEFSLLHDNSKHDDINYSRITNAFLHIIGRKGLTIKFDNLRACYYSNEGYVPNTDGFPDGCRILSRCDAQSLDGLVISEWYGAKMDFENKRYGTSCLAFNCTKKDDYRIFFGPRNITLNYNTDYICFWVKVPEYAKLATWFLEANQVQDSIEYENPGASVTNITQHAVGGFRYGEWNLIQLPLTALNKNNAGNTLNLQHFRMVPTSAGEDFTFLLDQVYVCNADQAAVAAQELLDERQAVADKAAAKVVETQIEGLTVQSLDDKPAVVAAR
ncbi:MAG: hypothetical protein IKT68_05095, partial [Clostridia bacterium]|nr:hypothetical protein [Clostridia bacterium]